MLLREKYRMTGQEVSVILRRDSERNLSPICEEFLAFPKCGIDSIVRDTDVQTTAHFHDQNTLRSLPLLAEILTIDD